VTDDTVLDVRVAHPVAAVVDRSEVGVGYLAASW